MNDLLQKHIACIRDIGQNNLYIGIYPAISSPVSYTHLDVYKRQFYHTAITEVVVPAGVKTWGKYVFSGCAKLKTARVACDSIGAFAFTRCTALSSLTISANCRTFGENMLTYCESLTAITYEGTIAQWNAITKPTNWMSSGKHFYDIVSQSTQHKQHTAKRYKSAGREIG